MANAARRRSQTRNRTSRAGTAVGGIDAQSRVPKLLKAALQPIKVGRFQPRFALFVDGRQRKLQSATVTFTADGNSGMKFVCHGSLEGLENTFAILFIGYGNHLVPYFNGRISEPNDDVSGSYSSGTAYGLSARLGTRYVGQRLTYNGQTLRSAVNDLMYRADIPASWWNMTGGQEMIEEDNEILFESSWLEAMRMLMDPLGYAAVDQPGIQEFFSIRRKIPAGGLFTDLDARINEGQYFKDGFEFTPGLRNHYQKVYVFRRSQDAEEGESTGEKFEVFAEREVKANTSVRGPLGGRYFIVPDFTGNQAQADYEARLTARYLSMAAGQFTLKMWPCDFFLYDTLAVTRTERVKSARAARSQSRFGDRKRKGDLIRWHYKLVVHTAELSIGPQQFEMSLSGEGVRHAGGVIRRQSVRTRKHRSSSLRTSAVAAPSSQFSNWGQTGVTFADLDVPFTDLR